MLCLLVIVWFMLQHIHVTCGMHAFLCDTRVDRCPCYWSLSERVHLLASTLALGWRSAGLHHPHVLIDGIPIRVCWSLPAWQSHPAKWGACGCSGFVWHVIGLWLVWLEQGKVLTINWAGTTLHICVCNNGSNSWLSTLPGWFDAVVFLPKLSCWFHPTRNCWFVCNIGHKLLALEVFWMIQAMLKVCWLSIIIGHEIKSIIPHSPIILNAKLECNADSPSHNQWCSTYWNSTQDGYWERSGVVAGVVSVSIVLWRQHSWLATGLDFKHYL